MFDLLRKDNTFFTIGVHSNSLYTEASVSGNNLFLVSVLCK